MFHQMATITALLHNFTKLIITLYPKPKPKWQSMMAKKANTSLTPIVTITMNHNTKTNYEKLLTPLHLHHDFALA